MTSEQVKMLKDSYMKEAKKPNGKKSTLGEYMRFHLDSSIDFVTSKDCVIFDDENTMLHCICINDDLKSQADFPLKVMTADYSVIHQIETIMSQENFKKFLEEGFISSLLSSEKKDFILKWAQNIRNQALQPMDADPFYSQNPQIIPMPTSIIKRDDGIEKATAPAKMNWAIPYAAKVNGVTYKNLNDAITAAIEQGVETVVLNENSNVQGLKIPEGSTLTIDLNGYEMIMQDPTTGSAGTQTNGFQFLKGSAITLKNGVIKMDTAGMKILVQNYADLTLENVTLDGTMEDTEGCEYVLSNNNGTITLKGTTEIIAAEGKIAMDAYYWPKAGYGDILVQTIDFTGSITGTIEVGHDSTVTDEEAAEHAKIILNGGTYNIEPDAAYIAEGYIVSQNEDGTYTVINAA